MTKSTAWVVPLCVGLGGAVGCYETTTPRALDAATPNVDAPRPDAPVTPGVLPQRCNLAWLRTVMVDPAVDANVLGAAVDREENVLLSFENPAAFIFDGVSYRAGYYLMGVDRENRLQVRPTERALSLFPVDGRIIGIEFDESGAVNVRELDGRTGGSLHDYGAFRVAAILDPHLAFAGDTLLISMAAIGELSFPGAAPRMLVEYSGVVLAARPDGWRGIAVLDPLDVGRATGQLPMGQTRDGGLLYGRQGALCFDGVCQDASSTRRLIRADGSVTSVPEGQIDREGSPWQMQGLSDGSLVTRGGGVVEGWDAAGTRRWSRDESWFVDLPAWDVEDRVGRFVTAGQVWDAPSTMLAGLRVELGGVDQSVFVDLSVTDGTPLRWWSALSLGERWSYLESPMLGPTGRTYATGVARSMMDVCGVQVSDALVLAAFD